MRRGEQSKLINEGVKREAGKLKVDHNIMWQLISKREEVQRGREAMKGYAYEEHRA